MDDDIFHVPEKSGARRFARLTEKGVDVYEGETLVHIRSADLLKMSELWLDEQRARGWKVYQSPEFIYAFPD